MKFIISDIIFEFSVGQNSNNSTFVGKLQIIGLASKYRGLH